MDPRTEYPAFCKWLERESSGNVSVCALLMRETLIGNTSSDNMVWDFLKATGHETYDSVAWHDAACIALDKEISHE